MQRKPRKDKVLLETAITTKMTDVLDLLAKCEVYNQNIEGSVISASPFGDCTNMEISLKGGGCFIRTMPLFQSKEFTKTVNKLVPKHVIVQYYS